MLACSGYGKKAATIRVQFPTAWRHGSHPVRYSQDDTYAYVRLQSGIAIGIAAIMLDGEPFASYVRLTPKEVRAISWQEHQTEKWQPKDRPVATFSFVNFNLRRH